MPESKEEIKRLKQTTALRDKYLKYSKRLKKAGKKPITYSRWKRTQGKAQALGKQSLKQLSQLSPSDYQSISKFFK